MLGYHTSLLVHVRLTLFPSTALLVTLISLTRTGQEPPKNPRPNPGLLPRPSRNASTTATGRTSGSIPRRSAPDLLPSSPSGVAAPPRIVPERLLELLGYDFLDVQLHQTGLWSFVSKARKEINPALILFFYSNLRREDNVIYSLVKSTPIEVNVERLGRIAGLPYQGDDISTYGGEDWVLNNEGLVLNELGITELIRHPTGRPTIHSMTPESRLLLYIVSRIIKPRKHGHTIMSGEDLKLLHAIMDSAPINKAKFVMIYMTDATSTAHNHLLPYPFLVMDILERFKAQANLASITDSLNRLNFKVNGMGGYLEWLDEAVQHQGYAMNAYFQRVNYVPPPYQGTFLGQVYGDDDEEDGSYAPSSSPDEGEFDDAIDGDEMDVDDDEEETEALLTQQKRCQAIFHPSKSGLNSDVQVMHIDVGT
ncbi:unnamed protein product [Cuscuta campestris]|uniref:Putative plant transposon protein domain-containing protein n=1 Tax=Cuscuta campestris TaxID=132261 RepID=A0A484MAY6_9ASTE|nr:unnamed protein product [Cuscuta campestris]